MHEMLRHPAVAVTAILAGLLLLLSLVGAITFLAYTGKGTEALTGAIVVPLIGVLVSFANRLAKIEKNTNGTNTRLLDAALPTPASPDVTQ